MPFQGNYLLRGTGGGRKHEESTEHLLGRVQAMWERYWKDRGIRAPKQITCGGRPIDLDNRMHLYNTLTHLQRKLGLPEKWDEA